MAKADRDLLIVEDEPRVSKLPRFFPLLAMVLVFALDLPTTHAHSHQVDPVHVYCWTIVHTNPRIDFCSRIFISGLNIGRYKDRFERRIIQTNPP
jgi:hypothetical protein